MAMQISLLIPKAYTVTYTNLLYISIKYSIKHMVICINTHSMGYKYFLKLALKSTNSNRKNPINSHIERLLQWAAGQISLLLYSSIKVNRMPVIA